MRRIGIETVSGLPSKRSVTEVLESIMYYLFPIIEGGNPISISKHELEEQLTTLLSGTSKCCKSDLCYVIESFLSSLPELAAELESDAIFIEEGDPAAKSTYEVIITYPGFYAISVYRIANRFYRFGVELIPRIMTEHAHSVTGIDIHPGATIGSEFCIDHGTGVVIGESTIIGNRVKIYQGVTLGALSVHKAAAETRRHPVIEDGVVIYAGATILGGDTVIGRNSIIGGNVWLTDSVPPASVVQNRHSFTVRKKKRLRG